MNYSETEKIISYIKEKGGTVDVHCLDSILKDWEQMHRITKPSFIKDVKMVFSFEDIGDEYPILMGSVKLLIETEDKSGEWDLCADVESYHDDKSLEQAKETLIVNMKEHLMDEIEDTDINHLWDQKYMDHIRWKKKDE